MPAVPVSGVCFRIMDESDPRMLVLCLPLQENEKVQDSLRQFDGSRPQPSESQNVANCRPRGREREKEKINKKINRRKKN